MLKVHHLKIVVWKEPMARDSYLHLAASQKGTLSNFQYLEDVAVAPLMKAQSLRVGNHSLIDHLRLHDRSV